MPRDETLEDVDWLRLTGTQGLAVFMKDEAIRRNQRERDVVRAFSVRCFCLTRQGLTAPEMASRFIDNLDAITGACRSPGPFIFAVEKTRIVQRL
ncbi:MAG: hypothetical protein F4110_04295 [Acidimicrobiaceae bacterium]|nr:hypothetical protein [Acidimicrobiaceae bacterium]MXZ99613.1 hypothetical protein [Acidimicrobiaceae bacterium]MYE75510.1 hypothetical protein [Acidimicrobiaceae bacterium]MYE97876.1 hypothetical protein [Acidimicrobiaceae bacterium]MYH44295.1 hypothetical protein [Acidimicrobiaceae bacterium]